MKLTIQTYKQFIKTYFDNKQKKINYDIACFLTEYIKSHLRKNNSFYILKSELEKLFWNEFKNTVNNNNLILIMNQINVNLYNCNIKFYIDEQICVAGFPINYKGLSNAKY